VQEVCRAAAEGLVEINGRKPDIFAIFNFQANDIYDINKGIEVQSLDYSNEDSDTFLRDYIDPSEEGIEASFNIGSSSSGSLRLFHISRHANTPPRNY
jgi:hypothetical protein